MIFSACLTLGLTFLFLGASFGSALCVAVAKVLKRKYLLCRFSLFCVFLSFSVASAAVFAIFVQSHWDFRHIFSSGDSFYFLLFLFLFGIVVSSFWKFVLIPIVLVYFFFSFHVRNLLNERFSSSFENCPITLDSSDSYVLMKIYKIPSNFLVPVNRFYYEIEIVKEDSDFFEDDSFFLNKFDSSLLSLLLRDVDVRRIEVPPAKFYPSLYMINFKSGMDDFDLSVSRTL